MLVKFILDLDAIDKNTRSKDLKLLLDKWTSFGVLVHPNYREAKQKIIAILRELDPEPRMLWKKIWHEAGNKSNPSLKWHSFGKDRLAWNAIESGDDLSRHSGKFEVALLEDSRASKLDIPQDKSKLFGEIEGIRFSDITISEKLENKYPKEVGVGERREDIWENYFHTLAQFSTKIVIVDRYATTDQNIEALFWLIRRFTEVSRISHIQINSSVVIEQNRFQSHKSSKELRAREIKDMFLSEFHDETVIQTEIRLFDRDVFMTHAHDRHMRFDNHVFDIGTGPSRLFSSEEVPEGTKVSLEVLRGAKTNLVEQMLDKNKNRLVIDPFTIGGYTP